MVCPRPEDGFFGLGGAWQVGQQQQGAGGGSGGGGGVNCKTCNDRDWLGSALPDLAQFMTQLLRGGSPVCAEELGKLGAAQGGSWVLLQSLQTFNTSMNCCHASRGGSCTVNPA